MKIFAVYLDLPKGAEWMIRGAHTVILCHFMPTFFQGEVAIGPR